MAELIELWLNQLKNASDFVGLNHAGVSGLILGLQELGWLLLLDAFLLLDFFNFLTFVVYSNAFAG